MINKTKQLRCGLIFLGPFPVGNVSTIRIMSYCKAMAKEGVFIKVLLLAPTAEAAVNHSKSGLIDGVEYEYMTDITWKYDKTPSYIKFFYYILGLLHAVKYLRRDKINCLLSYHNEFISNIFFRIITKIMSIPFIIDKTEYPKRYFEISSFRKRIERFKLSMFDGFISITQELRTFYSELTGIKSEKLFLLPMTISMDRYLGLTKKENNKHYVATVFGTHNRDGLFESIISYHKYRELDNSSQMNLVLIGDYEGLCEKFPECKKILEYVVVNNLESTVDFKGLVPISDVPQILLNAECLLTTPLEYVSGGFPTKLGEYLLSGVPVVATSAGEIPNYLTHKENVLLSLPGDLDGVAHNILFIEQNKKEAQSIGSQGQKLAMKTFNADTYAEDLIKFLKSFIS